jgi:hypothetical protein
MSADSADVATRTKDTVASTARRTAGPARAAALAAASLAGGVAVGARLAPKRRGLLPGRRRRVFGVPIGREPASVSAAKALAGGARRLVVATRPLTSAADDVHEVRKQLEQANRQSPVEVLLSGLTHRRGAHRDEH